jgi:hypothetical protein
MKFVVIRVVIGRPYRLARTKINIPFIGGEPRQSDEDGAGRAGRSLFLSVNAENPLKDRTGGTSQLDPAPCARASLALIGSVSFSCHWNFNRRVLFSTVANRLRIPLARFAHLLFSNRRFDSAPSHHLAASGGRRESSGYRSYWPLSGKTGTKSCAMRSTQAS